MVVAEAASAVPAEEVVDNLRSLRKRLRITQAHIARLTGYSQRAVAGWESGKPMTGPVRKQIAELTRLQTALAEIIDERHVAQWLDTPNPAFDGLKPLEVIERGEVDRIWRMIYYLGSGTPT